MRCQTFLFNLFLTWTTKRDMIYDEELKRKERMKRIVEKKTTRCCDAKFQYQLNVFDIITSNTNNKLTKKENHID